MSLSNCFSKIFGKKKKDDSGKKVKAGSTISQRTGTKEEKNPSVVSVVKEEKKATKIDTLKSPATTQSPHTPTTSSTPIPTSINSRSTTTTPRTRSTTPVAASPNGDDYHQNHHHHNGKHRRSRGKSSKRSRLWKRASTLSSRRHRQGSESSKRKAESKRSSTLSDRGIRIVKKKMVSRPIKDSALKKMAERVEARRQDTPKKPLKTGDLFFPKKKSSKNSTTGTTEDLTKNTMQAFAKASFSRLPKRVESTREYIPVKNNDNDGKLFVKNKEGKTVPFWKEDPPAAEEAEEDTEDDMVLNADAVLDVLNGTLQLAEAPDVEVLFDPYQSLDALQKKDDLFFTPPLLLGNSLRSMINLTEPPGQSELLRAAHQKKRRKSKREMKFAEEPAKVTLYDAEKPGEHKQRPWKPSGKKIVY